MNDPLEIPDGVGLHLVLGPPNAGKLGLVLRWWMAHESERPLVVVPTRADVADVELELLARVPVVLDDAPVRAVDGLVAALRPPGPPIMADLRRSVLIGDILAESPARGTRAALSQHPGGRAALLALLDEMGDGGLPEGRVEAAFERWAANGGGSRAAELRAVHRAYVAGLRAWGLVDRHQALAAAVDGCEGWRRPVAFHGFTTFTPAQRRLVRALARQVAVVVTLAADPRRPLPGGPAEEVAKLRPIARSETALPRQALAFASPSVAHLEKNFLVEEAAPWTGLGPGEAPAAGGPALEGVRFLLSAGRRNEVELAAAEIVSLLRSGLRPDDIAVLVRRIEPWSGCVREVFGRYGVPHDLDGTVPLGATGLGFALLSALRGLGRGDPDALLGYLRGPYHPVPLASVDAAEVGLRRRMGDRSPVDVLESVLPGSLEVARAAVRWEREVAAGVDPDGVRVLVTDMLAASARDAAPGAAGFEQDARAFDALARSLDDLRAADTEAEGGDRPGRGLAGRSFEEVLSLLAELPVSLGRGDEGGAVRVTTVSRARARRFPVVFVLGLADGEFPGSERPPVLLGAAERGALVDDDGCAILSSEGRSDDAALFASALSRPWQLLYLSAREAEDDGAETQPSPFWLEARRLLPGVLPGPRRGMEDVVFPPTQAPTEREFLRACAALDLLPSDPERAAHLERPRKWECRPSRLTHPAVLTALASREVFSATELEKYAHCPFGWFAERAVGLNTMEEDFGALQTGGLLHQVLRAVYEALGDAGEPRLTPESLPEALATADRALAALVAGMRGQWSDPELELAQAWVGELVRAFLDFDARSDSALTIAGIESSLPAEGVDLGGFRLRGRIDRMDRDPLTGALVVVDYKSGSDVRGSEFAKRGFLQVPLYVAALREGSPATQAAGGVYVGLKTGTRRGMVLAEVAERAGDWVSAGDRVAPEALEEELVQAVAAARRAADGIRCGDIRPEPLDACPDYCALSPLCRTPRTARTW